MVLPVSSLDEVFGARAAIVVPDVIGAAGAADVRARLERGGFRRYALVDRGSYAWTDDVDEPALVAELATIAGEVTGVAPDVAPDVGSVVAIRLGPGDYVLAHHDPCARARAGAADRLVELVLDVSATATAGAEVHYRRHGQLFHRVPSQPGALSVVERDAGITSHHTYVTKRNTTAGVTRLVVRLRLRSP